MPDPLTASAAGVFEALLAKLRVPDAAPEADGLNVAVNEAVLPALIVNGSVTPLTENSELVVPIEETVTLAPVAVSVPDWLWVKPTTTFPKFMVVGVTASWPGVAPVPERLTDREGFEPLEAMANEPVADPFAVGAKVTLNVTVWPGLKVAGGLTPLILNPVPLGVIEEIVRALPPEFERTSDRVLVEPVATLPKVRLAGLALIVPGVTAVPDSARLNGELEPSLTMARVPVALPAAEGANFTEMVALWLAFRVVGKVRPLMVNALLPERLAWEIVRLPVPVFVTVSEMVEFLPT